MHECDLFEIYIFERLEINLLTIFTRSESRTIVIFYVFVAYTKKLHDLDIESIILRFSFS